MGMGLSVVEILWDLEKFYDTLNPAVMAKIALSLQYPVIPLYLGLLVHRAARVIRLQGCFSDFVVPKISILAGCKQSVAWTRCFLYDTLEELHRRYRPATVSSWVDDLSQRQSGNRQHVLEGTVSTAEFLASSIQAKGARVSPKSQILASDPKLAKEVQALLSAKGIHLKLGDVGRDLGVDATCATKRRVPTQKVRFAKGVARAKAVRKLLKTKSKARPLVNTGAKPQLIWGHQAKGMAPSTVVKLKATLAVCSCLRKSGGCTTTSLQMEGGVVSDPEYFIRSELFSTWLDVWGEHSRIHLAIGQVWAGLVDKLSVPSRWNRVKGIIGAVIATLFDIGWIPQEPSKWVDPQGVLWVFDYTSPHLNGRFFQNLQEQIQAIIWAKAATHYLGTGLESGVDWTVSRKHLRHLRGSGHLDKAGCLCTIAQGAFWTSERKRQAGYDIDDVCIRCNSDIDSPLHQFWQCPANEGLGEEIVSTQELAFEAIEGSGQNPGFWLRGLTPKAWSFSLDPMQSKSQVWGVFQEQGARLQPSYLLATDGSGGEHGNDVRLRRVGWGLVLLNIANAQPLGTAYGTVEGSQTVPRAELYALVFVAENTQGSATVLIDSSYVVKGFSKGSGVPQSKNKELWARLWKAVRDRVGILEVAKVRAHATPDALEACQIPPLHFIANAMADALADMGSKLAALPEHRVREVLDLDLKARRIQERLVAISLCLIAGSSKPVLKRNRSSKKRALEHGETSLEKCLKETPHSIMEGPTLIKCTRCNKSSPRKFAHLWLKGVCSGSLPGNIHSSHHKHLKTQRGLRFCSRCGGIASHRVRTLKNPCPSKPTVSGKKVLNRILKGQLPFGMRSWPDQD